MTSIDYTQKIPNNVDAGGDMTPITYNTPFNLSATTGTINSIFPSTRAPL